MINKIIDKRIWLLLVAMVFLLPISAQNDSIKTNKVVDPSQAKTEADSAYNKTSYDSAINLYESILKQGESPVIYYNLGNSYFKVNKIGKAILNYERALLLDPGNSDIQNNLKVAKAKTKDNIEPIPEIFFVSWIKSLIHVANIKTWSNIAIVSFILLIICFLLFKFSSKERLNKIGFWTGLALLVVTVLANIFASYQKGELTNRDSAIILSPAVTVRSTPSESGTELFIIHEGCKVFINDNTMSDWKEVKLEDGKIGWIPKADLEMI